MTPPRKPGSPLRWWIGVTVGTVLIAPLGVLLSYAATLPFFLGLFFFVLFGLIIGAITHRVAAAGRPYAMPSLIVGTTVIVLVGWAVSLYQEAHDFPSDMSEQASRTTLDIGDQGRAAFRAEVEASIARHLLDKYAPGGSLGYVRWVLADGKLRPGTIPGIRTTLEAAHRGLTWVIRVVLSLALLAFGIGSQTFVLRLDEEPIVRAIDRKSEELYS